MTDRSHEPDRVFRDEVLEYFDQRPSASPPTVSFRTPDGALHVQPLEPGRNEVRYDDSPVVAVIEVWTTDDVERAADGGRRAAEAGRRIGAAIRDNLPVLRAAAAFDATMARTLSTLGLDREELEAMADQARNAAGPPVDTGQLRRVADAFDVPVELLGRWAERHVHEDPAVAARCPACRPDLAEDPEEVPHDQLDPAHCQGCRARGWDANYEDGTLLWGIPVVVDEDVPPGAPRFAGPVHYDPTGPVPYPVEPVGELFDGMLVPAGCVADVWDAHLAEYIPCNGELADGSEDWCPAHLAKLRGEDR